MTRSRHFGTALLLALTLGACDARGTLVPTEPAATSAHGDLFSGQGPTSQPLFSMGGGPPHAGSLLEYLAAKIPGFIGLYRSGECEVTVVLADLSQANLAKQVVHAALAPIHPCHGLVQVAVEQGRAGRLQARPSERTEPTSRDRARSGRNYEGSPEPVRRDEAVVRSVGGR